MLYRVISGKARSAQAIREAQNISAAKSFRWGL
jgi:hypothetical protein